MKKSIYFLAIFFACITFSNAQVTFKPGFRAGLNVSHFSKGNDAYYSDYYYDDYASNRRDFTSVTSFYVGFLGDLKLTKYYSLQPELNFSKQGSTYNYVDDNQRFYRDYDLSYLSVGIANKFTFNKFNVHVGPTIEFLVDSKIHTNEPYYNSYNSYNYDGTDAGVDLAFFLGAGYDITSNFGVEARIKKGLIPVLDYSDGNHTNVVFSAGAYYKFDVK